MTSIPMGSKSAELLSLAAYRIQPSAFTFDRSAKSFRGGFGVVSPAELLIAPGQARAVAVKRLHSDDDIAEMRVAAVSLAVWWPSRILL